MKNSELAKQFAERHRQSKPLVLPNVWDAGSARLMRSLGAEAIATTSSGLAWVHGYPDGDKLPIEVHVIAVMQIARVVDCPISVDAEGGYSDDGTPVGENVARLIDAGAVGFNLEDGQSPPDVFCRKIEAAKAAGARSGVDVFVNARTDVYLRELAPGREVEETLHRAKLYVGAGADGLFVPSAIAAADIDRLVRGQPLPVNVMARPGLPSLDALTRLGVRRISAGAAIAQRIWALAQHLGEAFLVQGSTDDLFAGAAAYGTVNSLMS